jgi:hypothetical protein
MQTYLSSVKPTSRRLDLTPQELARECLAEADNDLDRACKLAGKRARGAKLRAVTVAIGDAVRGSTE